MSKHLKDPCNTFGRRSVRMRSAADLSGHIGVLSVVYVIMSASSQRDKPQLVIVNKAVGRGLSNHGTYYWFT